MEGFPVKNGTIRRRDNRREKTDEQRKQTNRRTTV